MDASVDVGVGIPGCVDTMDTLKNFLWCHCLHTASGCEERMGCLAQSDIDSSVASLPHPNSQLSTTFQMMPILLVL